MGRGLWQSLSSLAEAEASLRCIGKSKAADKSVRATRSPRWIVQMGIKRVTGGMELLFWCLMWCGAEAGVVREGV